MKLHLDKDAFRVLIETIHEKTGYRADVLEKDYYVVLMLEELTEKQAEGLPAFFKGETALYKALKSTNRFSEDIELSVDTRNCSRTQNDKRLEQATKKYTSLIRDPAAGRTNRSEIIAVFTYEPITSYDVNDALQRFGKLKIEATSFTISEPVESLEISAMLYNLATDEQKHILTTQYDVKPFSIQMISLERIFIDKLFAAEAYMRKSSDPHRKKYFKKTYGYGFKEYQTKVRMEFAAKQLTETDLSIGEIADLVGYSKQTKFTKAFKAYYDVTPSEYRKRAIL